MTNIKVTDTHDPDSDTDSSPCIKGITIHIQRDCRNIAGTIEGAVAKINLYMRNLMNSFNSNKIFPKMSFIPAGADLTVKRNAHPA